MIVSSTHKTICYLFVTYFTNWCNVFRNYIYKIKGLAVPMCLGIHTDIARDSEKNLLKGLK